MSDFNPAPPDQREDDLEAVLAQYPLRLDRRDGAAFVTRHFFKIAACSLERWADLDEIYVNGRIMLLTSQLAAGAMRRLAAATAPPDPRVRRPEESIVA